MTLLRPTVGIATIALAVPLTQSPDETRAKETALIVTEGPAKSADRNKLGIFDVHNGRVGVSTDGTRYANW